VEWVSAMIQEDARRILELDETIKALEVKTAEVAETSTIAKLLRSIPGYGAICTSELAGEIGTIERFNKEGSLALYWAWPLWITAQASTKAPSDPSISTRAPKRP